jgi:tryptophan-rich sensory protein
VTDPKTRWYRNLSKSPLNPPDWVFAPVWTVLYALIAFSGWRVFRKRVPGRASALALWGGGLLANAAWSPLFFGLRRPKAALADLNATLLLTSAYFQKARKVDAPAAWMVLPYLGWLSFADMLNEEIVRKNP